MTTGTGAAFPADFAWGTATAAYQIEGACAEDGKGESIWDRFTHTSGTIADQQTGDVACDHYHRWLEDVELLARLSQNAYRLSISWPRVLPEGRGRVNAAGLDFYDRVIEALVARGIAPYVTLYHWDLPQALQDRGGWGNRDTAGYFADFAELLARRLGDRVSHWITQNEPQVVVYDGHVSGEKAPGLRDRRLIAPVSHHLLLAHGWAVQALRATLPPGRAVGITVNLSHIEPASDREEDAQAAHRLDGLWHRLYLDPLLRGSYPEDLDGVLAFPPELVRAGDLDAIHQPLDFLGLNYYTRTRVRAGRGRDPEPEVVPPSGALTTMGWEVYPDGLYAVLTRLHAEYAPPRLYVTENGAAYPDTLTLQGEVHDRQRTDYLREHLLAARRAIAAGVPLHGYFLWTLMDNFEWAHGFTQRFGIVYTDYATQRRYIKDSGHFYGRVAATNGGALDEGL
jgi:beta-glucosidase